MQQLKNSGIWNPVFYPNRPDQMNNQKHQKIHNVHNPVKDVLLSLDNLDMWDFNLLRGLFTKYGQLFALLNIENSCKTNYNE